MPSRWRLTGRSWCSPQRLNKTGVSQPGADGLTRAANSVQLLPLWKQYVRMHYVYLLVATCRNTCVLSRAGECVQCLRTPTAVQIMNAHWNAGKQLYTYSGSVDRRKGDCCLEAVKMIENFLLLLLYERREDKNSNKWSVEVAQCFFFFRDLPIAGSCHFSWFADSLSRCFHVPSVMSNNAKAAFQNLRRFIDHCKLCMKGVRWMPVKNWNIPRNLYNWSITLRSIESFNIAE